jgi:hypothetical protein
MRLFAVLALSILAFASAPVLADKVAADGSPLLLEKLTLAHQKPTELMNLFLSKKMPIAVPGQRFIPLGESYLPKGIEGVLAFQLDNSLIVRGTSEALEALKRGIQIADVKIDRPSKEQAVAVLTPKRLHPRFLREQFLKLPDAGTATVKDEQLTICGSTEWVEEALRIAIRGEIGE